MDVGMMSDELLYRLENRVAVITLNRPERLNALTKDMMQALRVRLAECAVDEAIGCVVLTGAGSAFCAGGDVRVQAQVAAEGSRGDAGASDRSAACLDGGIAAAARDAEADDCDAEWCRRWSGAVVGVGMRSANRGTERADDDGVRQGRPFG